METLNINNDVDTTTTENPSMALSVLMRNFLCVYIHTQVSDIKLLQT